MAFNHPLLFEPTVHFLTEILPLRLAFMVLKSDNDHISLVYSHLRSEGIFQMIGQPYSTKSSAQSLEYRKLGNEAFYRRHDIEALKMYTQSVAFALPGSSELAIAYANRSAALFRLERFEACIVDCNRALKEKYPDALKCKLHDRKERCLQLLAKPSVSNRNKRCRQKLNVNKFDASQSDMNFEAKFPLPTIDCSNEIVPNASGKLRIHFSEEFGRHIVATQDILPGEVLCFEKPFASLLHSDYSYSHCGNCFVRCESLISCATCSLIMFCSERCRQNAYDQFHRVECQIFSMASRLQFKRNEWLNIRLLMIATKQGEELETLMNHPIFKKKNENMYDWKREPFYHAENFVNVQNFQDNYKHLSHFEAKFQFYQMAAVILHILKQTEFFGESNGDAAQNSRGLLTDKELFVGRLALKYSWAVLCNRFEIFEGIEDESSHFIGSFNYLSHSIGSAIYPFHNFFNHSCDENVSLSFHKDVIVSHSIRTIKAGEQVFVNYGPCYKRHSRYDRQIELMRRYFFICHCDACQFNWPVSEDVLSCKIKVKGKILKKVHQYNARLVDQMKRGMNPENALLFNTVREYLLFLHENVEKPSLEQLHCENILKLLFSLKGNSYGLASDAVLSSL